MLPPAWTGQLPPCCNLARDGPPSPKAGSRSAEADVRLFRTAAGAEFGQICQAHLGRVEGRKDSVLTRPRIKRRWLAQNESAYLRDICCRKADFYALLAGVFQPRARTGWAASLWGSILISEVCTPVGCFGVADAHGEVSASLGAEPSVRRDARRPFAKRCLPTAARLGAVQGMGHLAAYRKSSRSRAVHSPEQCFLLSASRLPEPSEPRLQSYWSRSSWRRACRMPWWLKVPDSE